MHPSSSTPTAKGFSSERAMPVPGAKIATALPQGTQKLPSRPASTAPNMKPDTERVKTPLTESALGIRDEPGAVPTQSIDTLRRTPIQAFPNEGGNMVNLGMRPGPGAAPHGYVQMTGPIFPSPGTNMNIAPQQGYPAAQMSFFTPTYPPNGFAPNLGSARPNSAIPKYPNMEAKFVHGPNQLGHSAGLPSLQNNMTRRPSNYIVAPSMSPVQTAYGPTRNWIPSNAAVLPGPVHMQNGSMQNATIYQPTMLPGATNPGLLTPPGGVQPGFSPYASPPAAAGHPFGYGPTPGPENTVVNPDIPPPIPSVYPDPAYSNINNCLYNPKGTTNVYIRGLRPETNDEDLLHMVRAYGSIVSTKAIIDTQTNLCKG
jgi:hypothetical protein